MNFKLGDVDTYPDSMKWVRIAKIPMMAALHWAASACPHAVIGSMSHQTALVCLHHQHPDETWLNKVMVVVQPRTPGFGPIALYKHDGTYWILQYHVK